MTGKDVSRTIVMLGLLLLASLMVYTDGSWSPEVKLVVMIIAAAIGVTGLQTEKQNW